MHTHKHLIIALQASQRSTHVQLSLAEATLEQMCRQQQQQRTQKYTHLHTHTHKHFIIASQASQRSAHKITHTCTHMHTHTQTFNHCIAGIATQYASAAVFG
jgi:Fe2+ transport system protein B